MQLRSNLALLALAVASTACSIVQQTPFGTGPLRNFNTLSAGEKQQFTSCVVRTAPRVSPQRLQQGVNETMARNPKIRDLFRHPETRESMVTSVAVALAQGDCASAQGILPRSVPPINITFKLPSSTTSGVTF